MAQDRARFIGGNGGRREKPKADKGEIERGGVELLGADKIAGLLNDSHRRERTEGDKKIQVSDKERHGAGYSRMRNFPGDVGFFPTLVPLPLIPEIIN